MGLPDGHAMEQADRIGAISDAQSDKQLIFPKHTNIFTVTYKEITNAPNKYVSAVPSPP